MVFREWHRHRTQSYNEMSARYIQMPNEHYVPEAERIQKQSSINKQSSGEAMPLAEALAIAAGLKEEQQEVYENYDELVAQGVAKEVARINTPVARYSVMRAKANVRNWMAFFALRVPTSAQWEIRQYAEAATKVFNEFFPRTYSLFEEHTLYGTRFSRTEMELLKFVISSYQDNAGSIPTELLKEFQDKLGEKKTETSGRS
jgi:thymidylate synthase (FAD)